MSCTNEQIIPQEHVVGRVRWKVNLTNICISEGEKQFYVVVLVKIESSALHEHEEVFCSGHNQKRLPLSEVNNSYRIHLKYETTCQIFDA